MRTSFNGILEILSHEAIVTSTYRDSVGVATIGVGHTKNAGGVDPVKVTRTLSVDECLDIFLEDLRKFEKRVQTHMKQPRKQHEFDAAVSFDFNTGGIHRATWVKRHNEGRKGAAAEGIMSWRKPPEIIPRRRKEQTLYRDGKYSHKGSVTVYRAKDGNVIWGSAEQHDISDILHRKIAFDDRPPPPDIEPPPEPENVSLIARLARRVFLWVLQRFTKGN